MKMPQNLSILLSRGVKTIIALIGLLVLLSCSSEVLANRSIISNIYDEFYRYAADSPVDILIAGTSQSQCAVNTLMLSSRLGVNAYTLSMPAQTIGLTRYALEDALRWTKPKVVLIDTYFIGEPEPLSGRESFIYEQLAAMRSWDIKTACITRLFPHTQALDAAFPAIPQHNGWKDPELLRRNALYRYDSASIFKNMHYQGFTPQTSIMTWETYRIADMTDYSQLPPIPETSWTYINEIISLCREAQAEPVFIQLPLLEAYNRKAGYADRAEEMQRGFEKLGVRFIDFNSTEGRSDLALTPMDYLNERSAIGNHHLNISGANKLTARLAEMIASSLPQAADHNPRPGAPLALQRFVERLAPDDLVFVTVNDDASSGWLPEELKRLEALGLVNLPAGHWGHSYLAVFTGSGTVLMEQRSSETLSLSKKRGVLLGGHPLPVDLEMVSAGVASGLAESRLLINGTDYAFNYRGLNIAVINKNNGEIRTLEQFDLYERSLYLDQLYGP